MSEPVLIDREEATKERLTIQECIDRGWVACPECGTMRGVQENGDVLGCGKCSDVFPQQRNYWNLFVTLHE